MDIPTSSQAIVGFYGDRAIALIETGEVEEALEQLEQVRLSHDLFRSTLLYVGAYLKQTHMGHYAIYLTTIFGEEVEDIRATDAEVDDVIAIFLSQKNNS